MLTGEAERAKDFGNFRTGVCDGLCIEDRVCLTICLGRR